MFLVRIWFHIKQALSTFCIQFFSIIYVSLYNSFLLILGFFYVITYGLVSVLSDSCQGKLLIKNNTPKMMGAHSFLTQKIAESHFRVFVLYWATWMVFAISLIYCYQKRTNLIFCHCTEPNDQNFGEINM